MESGLRIIDEYTSRQVFRVYDSLPWRDFPKRALLDTLCPDCRVLAEDFCPAHRVEEPVLATT